MTDNDWGNSQIAEHLFGMQVGIDEYGGYEMYSRNFGWESVPEYFDDEDYVGPILMRLSKVGKWAVSKTRDGAYKVNIQVEREPSGSAHSNLTIIRDSLPHALCSAALIGLDVPGAFST